MLDSISLTHDERDTTSIKTLHEYLRDYHKISIIGIAKNAGKTTVLNEIIRLYKTKHLALTSIGLDGEKIDNITQLEKPRVQVYKGMYVATAEQCLNESTMQYVIHEKTDIRTALGSICIVEVLEDGLVLLAGPPSKNTMKSILDQINKYKPFKVLVDGALFRKSIASTTISDAIIFVTGASYNSNIDVVVNDTRNIIDQLSINGYNKHVNMNENIIFIDENGRISNTISTSVLNKEEDIGAFLNTSIKSIYFNGGLTDRIVEVLILNRNKLNDLTCIVQDASFILISPDNYEKLRKMNVQIRALNQIEILFVAYNPVSPYSYDFDNNLFRAKLKEKLDIDVINILQDMR